MSKKTLIEALTAHGCRVEIHHDEFAENPREVWDHLGTFWGWGRHAHSIGDANPGIDPRDHNGWEAFDSALREARPKIRVALPVYGYSHGGTVYSTAPYGCRWDSGRVGVIFYESGGDIDDWNDEKITEALTAEIAEFSAWANGEFCEFIVFGDDGDHAQTGSMFAKIEDAKAEAEAEAEAYRERMDAAVRLEAFAFAL